MTANRHHLLRWSEQGKIPTHQSVAALKTAGILPSPRDWSRFLSRLLLITGTLSLAVSVIFFFAYNWHAMGRITKFSLIELAIILALAGYWYFGGNQLIGKIILTAAAILLGGLMALFGQIYQTGADTWQLFAGWAVLIFPWVLIGRFAILWLLWALLINLSIYLYFSVFSTWWWFHTPTETLLWGVSLFNTVLLVFWEWGTKYFSWLDHRWAVRLVAVASGVAITILMIFTIVEWEEASGLNMLFYLGWCAGIYGCYRHYKEDLFMLAGLCLSAIVVTTVFLARVLLDFNDAGGFLFIALAVVAMSAASAIWLKNTHKEMAK